MSAEETDLGYGITGYMDAGAGSVFLTWHEGRWSFSTRNHNDGNGSEEMIALAKQIVVNLKVNYYQPRMISEQGCSI